MTAILIVVAVVLFLLSLCAIIPPQTYTMWKLQIVASEWGHLIALAAIVVLLFSFFVKGKSWRAIAIFAAVAFFCGISPVIRVGVWSRHVERRLMAAFGDAEPRMMPGAAMQNAPFLPPALFAPPAAPEVRVSTEKFAGRDGIPLEMDIYSREGAEPAAPIVVVLYGGSWRSGSKADLPQLNRYLAARGYIVAAPTYRFAPRYRFPSQTDDVNEAINFLEKNAARFHADQTRIVLVGRSAGGQLALESAYTKKDPAIRGVVGLYAPSDQRWGWDHPANQRVYKSLVTLRDFLGGAPSEEPDAYWNSSPINFVDSSTVPTLLIHGSRDPLVSVVQSRRLDSALASKHRPHLLLELPWATHGCDYFFTGPCGQVTTFAVERFVADVTR